MRLPTKCGVNENEPANVFAFAERDAARPLPKPRTPDEPPRWIGRLAWAGVGTLAVVLLGGGTVYGAAAYGKSSVCASIETIGTNAATMMGPDATVVPAGVLAVTGRKLSDQTGLLIFHQDLEKSVNLLLADSKRLEEVDDAGVGPTDLPQLMALFQSVDQHFKQAQTACGMPASGILATGLGQAALTSVKTGGATAPGVSATPEPLPAPAYTASPGELTAAQNDVAQHRDQLADVLAGDASSSADRAVARYELAAARQRLADLKAGQPGAFHQALELRGAKAYLASAKENLAQVKADTTAAAGDLANARADVKKWQHRVTELS